MYLPGFRGSFEVGVLVDCLSTKNVWIHLFRWSVRLSNQLARRPHSTIASMLAFKLPTYYLGTRVSVRASPSPYCAFDASYTEPPHGPSRWNDYSPRQQVFSYFPTYQAQHKSMYEVSMTSQISSFQCVTSSNHFATL